MRIQLASDLHLEYLVRQFPGERLISPAHGADLLVLAGDIGLGSTAVDLFKDWPVPVLYVAGIHQVRTSTPFDSNPTSSTQMDNVVRCSVH